MRVTGDSEAVAYISTLVTVELCYEMHRNGKPNTAIRQCINRILPSIAHHRRIWLIFKGVARQPFPSGALHHLRSMLTEMAGGHVILEA